MISFIEFLKSNPERLQETELTKISPAHSALINPNPDLQRVLNRAARNSVVSANELAYLTKSVLNQSILTARRIKSLSPAQQNAVMIEQTAIIAALAHLFALYIQHEKSNERQ